MTEQNKTIVVLLVATICISLLGTFVTISRLSDFPGLTGFATSDSGAARIQIEALLAIDVVDNNASIDFGNCTPSSLPNTVVSISSEMTEAEINATDGADNFGCYASNIPAGIIVQNTGNVEAAVNVTFTVNGSTLLSSTRGELYYRTINAGTNGGCAPADAVTSYSLVTDTNDPYLVCQNLTVGEFSNAVEFYVNLTVPNDARTSTTNTTVLTFSAEEAE